MRERGRAGRCTGTSVRRREEGRVAVAWRAGWHGEWCGGGWWWGRGRSGRSGEWEGRRKGPGGKVDLLRRSKEGRARVDGRRQLKGLAQRTRRSVRVIVVTSLHFVIHFLATQRSSIRATARLSLALVDLPALVCALLITPKADTLAPNADTALPPLKDSAWRLGGWHSVGARSRRDGTAQSC